MARLYIVNPDGPGLYTWDFHSPEWFQRELLRGNWLVWAGFLKGVEFQVARQVAIARAMELGPVEYEPADPDD
jgi:hypothetical protein